jgi:3-oxoacyl-[acyl-carrier protein] reductase
MTGRPVAIVTGASSGIGAAAAIRLATAGHDVVLNYARNATGADAVAEACRKAGAEVAIVAGDIAEDAACRALAATAADRFGRIDVLVNNAGTTRYANPSDLEALDAADFARVFSVNVAGAYQMARAAAPLLKAAPSAAIVNVSSHSAFSGSGSSLAYAASKGALNTLTLGLARSLAPAIRVNAVCPGFVDTRWGLAWQTEASYDAFKDRAAAIAPLKRLPSADDVAEAILWLATNGACITGQLLVIDSGTHLTVGSPMA